MLYCNNMFFRELSMFFCLQKNKKKVIKMLICAFFGLLSNYSCPFLNLFMFFENKWKYSCLY